MGIAMITNPKIGSKIFHFEKGSDMIEYVVISVKDNLLIIDCGECKKILWSPVFGVDMQNIVMYNKLNEVKYEL
jgi:hypothetical protein